MSTAYFQKTCFKNLSLLHVKQELIRHGW